MAMLFKILDCAPRRMVLGTSVSDITAQGLFANQHHGLEIPTPRKHRQ